jgi:hypothetical protein
VCVLVNSGAIHSGNTVEVSSIGEVATDRLGSLLRAIQVLINTTPTCCCCVCFPSAKCKGSEVHVKAVSEVASPRLKELLEYCQVGHPRL